MPRSPRRRGAVCNSVAIEARGCTLAPMPRWDDLKPLPNHVVAPLLRALACIPRTADARLLLVKRTDGRPPGWDRENDYDVVFRGRKVGRIWKYDYTGKVSGEMARWLWHWDWRDVDGRKDAEGHCGSLEAAMLSSAPHGMRRDRTS